MDYSRPELADRLAAEYVLGTLRGPARRRLETLLPAHAHLQGAVNAWERRLLPMSVAVQPVKPSARVWDRVQSRLFAEAGAAPRALSWWQRLGLWQSATGVAFAAVFGMALLLRLPGDTPPPIVIVLGANPDAASGLAPARFVASLAADGRSLVLRPLDLPAISTARALELWAVPAQGAPKSLGLVSPDKGATIQRAGLLQDTAAFAVSLEPAGGSPTGAPTGPILSLGKVQL